MDQNDKNCLIAESLRANNYSCYKEMDVIGCGAFGSVYQCRDNITMEDFAMKKILIKDPKFEDEVIKEVLVFVSLDPHERLVQFYGSKRKSNCLHIFLEYMPQGSLQDYLKKNGPLSEQQASVFTKQILEGIEYLHRAKIIHRDIKPANILIEGDNNIKLTDFGLSKIVAELSALNVQTCVGTVKYMAPELLENMECNNVIDIWSLGVTVVEMMNGEQVFPELGPVQFMFKIIQPNFHFVLNKPASKELDYFLSLTFIKNAKKRPTATDMKHTKFITRNF